MEHVCGTWNRSNMIVSCAKGSLSTSLFGARVGGCTMHLNISTTLEMGWLCSKQLLRIICETPSSHHWGHLCSHEKYVAGCSGKAIQLKTHLPGQISFQPFDKKHLDNTRHLESFFHQTPFDISRNHSSLRSMDTQHLHLTSECPPFGSTCWIQPKMMKPLSQLRQVDSWYAWSHPLPRIFV